MAKKRKTKAQKIRTIQTHENTNLSPLEPVRFSFVNREFNTRETSEANQDQVSKKPVHSIQTTFLASAKKDLLKTFILASAILTLEAVLYFFWK